MRPPPSKWATTRIAALLVAALPALAACGSGAARHYYTLTYPVEEGTHAPPHPVTVRVKQFDVRDTYRGTELAFRPDLHEIRYYRTRRWSEPPKEMITALVREHLRRSGLVAQVTGDLGQTPPDYTLTGEILALEELEANGERYAHLAMRLKLQRFRDDQWVWSYRFDERRPVGGGEVRATVRVLSALMAEQVDAALEDLGRWFADQSGAAAPAPPATAPAAPPEPPSASGPPEPALIKPGTGPLLEHPQLVEDDTPMPVGFGAVFLPALSGGDREPPVALYRDDKLVAEGAMGRRIVVEPGRYEVRLGSGAVTQQITLPVQVDADRVTAIPPKWAALEIEVVDEQFIPFRGTYEVIRMEDRAEFGLGFGADELLGEELRTWILPPGLYKIIRAGGTYRDRTNFATVRLVPGRLTRFTLVMDPDTGDFRGAGEEDPSLEGEALADNRRDWALQGLLGGAVAFRRTDQIGEEEGWDLTIHFFFDGYGRYKREPHRFVTRLELEEAQNRPADDDRFDNVTDRLFLHSIYTYDLVPWFGPYVRAGLETKLLPRYQDFDGPRDVEELDEDGAVVEVHEDVDRVRLGGAFSPFQAIEGGGANFHLLQGQRVEVDLRLGVGARQTWSNGLLVFENDRLVPLQDSHTEGVEGTLVVLARISRWVTLSSEFDGLLPFGAQEADAALFTWRNQATVRLLSFLSLAYRFNASRDPNLGLGDDVRTEHDVQLRFSYNLF